MEAATIDWYGALIGGADFLQTTTIIIDGT
jgi:hypothetical protein